VKKAPANKTRSLATILIGVLTLGCGGTEADNPFAEPTEVTPCKSHEEYVAFDARREEPLASNAHAQRFENLGAALTVLDEVPIWLECVDWELNRDGLLSIQVLNFRGGCGVTWEGGTQVNQDGLTVELQNANPGCAIAGCGNCLYDVRTQIALSQEQQGSTLHLKLARLPCDGENGLDSDWVLPLAFRPVGTSCVLADPWGAAAAASKGVGRTDALFRGCTDGSADIGPEAYPSPLTDCGEGLSCVEQRCVPACENDADCPLGGALTCRDGFCQLPAGGE
jgi:hypothetical protein